MYSQTIARNISFQNLFHPRIYMVTKAFESKLIGFVRQNSVYVCGLRAIRSAGRVFSHSELNSAKLWKEKVCVKYILEDCATINTALIHVFCVTLHMLR